VASKVQRVLICVIVLGATSALGACGGSSKKSDGSTIAATTSSAPTTVPTTPSAPQSSAADQKPAVLAAYNGFVAAQTDMMATNRFTQKDLDYSDGDAYATIRQTVLADQKANIVYTGQPATTPSVTAVDTTAKAPTATVLDCFGGPTWTPVYSAGPKKGQSAEVASVPLIKHPVTVTVVDENNQWKVTEFKLDWSNSC
jgi:hypothetical protein